MTENDQPFADNNETEQLRAAVHQYCVRYWSEAQVRDVMESSGVPDKPWQTLGSELGVLGLGIPEEWDGSGGGLPELAVVAEEFGRSLVPLPWLSTAVATWLLTSLGDSAPQRFLSEISAGDHRVALVGPIDGNWSRQAESLTAVESRSGWTLSGTAKHVIDGPVVDRLLVIADDGRLLLVDADDNRVTITATPTLDLTRTQAHVSFDDAPAELLGATDEAIERVRHVAGILTSAESNGAAAAMLDAAVDYAKTRIQFGRAIGSFQAVKHRLVDMYVELEHARSATTYAAWAYGSPSDASGHDDRDTTSGVAHVLATQAVKTVTTGAIQVFAGIAITWEHSAHLYYKRGVTNPALWGGGSAYRQLLGDRVLGAPAAAGSVA